MGKWTNNANNSWSWLKLGYSHFNCVIVDEINREREFYRVRGLPCPKDIPPNPGDVDEDKSVSDVHAESDYHRQDEQVNVCLECTSSNLKTLKRRFIRCSAQATILHLKKFVAKKVLNGMEKYRDVGNNKNCKGT